MAVVVEAAATWAAAVADTLGLAADTVVGSAVATRASQVGTPEDLQAVDRASPAAVDLRAAACATLLTLDTRQDFAGAVLPRCAHTAATQVDSSDDRLTPAIPATDMVTAGADLAITARTGVADIGAVATGRAPTTDGVIRGSWGCSQRCTQRTGGVEFRTTTPTTFTTRITPHRAGTL